MRRSRGYREPLLRRLYLTDNIGVTGFGLVLMLIVTIVLLGAGIWFGANAINRADCAQRGTNLHVESHYKIISGCWLDLPNGKSIPADQWRVYQKGQVAHAAH